VTPAHHRFLIILSIESSIYCWLNGFLDGLKYPITNFLAGRPYCGAGILRGNWRSMAICAARISK
jgi:hypothetical protein